MLMDDPMLPPSPEKLSEQLLALRIARRNQHALKRKSPTRRISLTASERKKILEKTNGRCHICGGEITSQWEADHVLPHSNGGVHSVDNYLAAHSLCNNYRWSYTPEEFQWVLKIGVWARLQMERESTFGKEVARRFFEYDLNRLKRRKNKEK